MSPKFVFPKELPSVPAQIALVRVAPEAAQVGREGKERAFAERLGRLRDAFQIRGQVQDEGGEVVIRDGSQHLRIFRPSESLRWADEKLAASEKIREDLPRDEEAIEIAQVHLKKLSLAMDKAKVVGVSRVTVAMSVEGGSEVREAGDSEVQVSFGFWLGELPVFGPGAKIKVSLVGGGQVSSVLWYWREPIIDGTALRLPVLPAERALERLGRSRGYAALSDADTRVTLKSIRLGHYALPPFEMQKFLIPVYETTGVEETRLLGSREIRLYVPAVRISNRRVKEMGMVPEPDLNRYLVGTKNG